MATKEEKKKMLSLKEVEIEAVDGGKKVEDWSRDLAGLLYSNAQSLVVHVAAQDLYKNGECEDSDEVRNAILELANMHNWPFFLRVAIEKSFSAR